MFALSSQHTGQQMAKALREHGAAPGAQKMLEWEKNAAEEAIRRGVYVSWRSQRDANDCTRVGTHSMCFCGHVYGEHFRPKSTARNILKSHCKSCKCKRFAFIPIRPEEVGMWWLVRRPDFNIHTWAPKCRCKHTHKQHNGVNMRCKAKGCGCGYFESDFACVVCDLKWEEHETVHETEEDRVADGRPVGEAYIPLVEAPEIHDMVFNREGAPNRGKPRPKRIQDGSQSNYRVEEIADTAVVPHRGGNFGTGMSVGAGAGAYAGAGAGGTHQRRGIGRAAGGGGGGGGPRSRDPPARVAAQIQSSPARAGLKPSPATPAVRGRKLRAPAGAAMNNGLGYHNAAPRARRAPAGTVCRADASCRCRRCLASYEVAGDLVRSPSPQHQQQQYGGGRVGVGNTLDVLAGGDHQSQFAPAPIPRHARR